MGLDNYLSLITKEELDLDKIPKYVKITKDDWSTKQNNDGFYYDICYWRKCWNIRHIMLNILGVDINSWSNTYEFDKVERIIELRDKLLVYICDPEIWEQDFNKGETIWNSEEMMPQICQEVINLGWLVRYLHGNSSARVKFIDSY